jgi:hypothetical protein
MATIGLPWAAPGLHAAPQMNDELMNDELAPSPGPLRRQPQPQAKSAPKCLPTRVIGREPDDASPLNQVEALTQEKLPALVRRGAMHEHHAQARHEAYQAAQRLNTCQ